MGRRLLLLLAMAMLLAVPTAALDDDEFDGYAADTLTIRVGYFGGPYYEKAVFTLEELWAMDVVYADYTFIDQMPSVVIDHVAGVRLSDLMDAAGIDLNSIQTFYFWTRDKQGDYYTSYTKTELIDTPRYCYYSLPDNFDDEEGAGNEYATSDGVLVDTVIALADDWNRTIAGGTFGSDYLNLNTNTRFRLIFGQTNGYERTASRSAKWIHEIVVELGGAPTLTLDASALEGEVGSLLRTQASVKAEAAVAEQAPITWSSSDETVATVDENGGIRILGEGTAVITAEFAGVTASLTVTGLPGDSESAVLSGASGQDDGNGLEQESDAPEQAEPEPSAQETVPTEQPVSDPDEQGKREAQLVEPTAETETEQGGIQNWRVFEMSESARELPELEPDPSLVAGTAALAAGLFLLSGGVYAVRFYQNIKEKKTHVCQSSPE